MSTLETDIHEQDIEAPETGLLRREFAAEMTAGEGRTVDVRIVPYGERITHNDGLGGVPRGVDYQEEWLPGVFDHQVTAANRVLANVEHQTGIAGIVGHGIALRGAGDGFHGSFKMHETPDGDKALLLIREGVLSGVSLEAIPVKNIKSGTVIQRAKAHLRGIAFTRFGAYTGAKVLALREEATTVDAEYMPVDMDVELVERCRRLGIKLPQRYEAHPEDSGTPAEAGTPEDGTRPTDANHTSSEES